MSGGVAYIYDVKGNFELQCNKEMVDLDPLDSDDKKELHQLVSDHYKYTNSTVAKFVLDDFENQMKNFVKVFPKDYKKALQVKKQKLQIK